MPMTFSLRKFHAMITLIAVISVLCGVFFFFLSEVDQFFGWDILSGWLEAFLRIFAWVIAAMAFGTGTASLLISQYRQADQKD